MDIATIILDLRTSPNLQEFINRRFNDPAKIVLERHDVAGVLMTTGGKFKLTRMIGNATHVTREIDLTDIRPDDIVLDIGACIGGFTVPAALRCAHVYAVEPLYAGQLPPVETGGLRRSRDRLNLICTKGACQTVRGLVPRTQALFVPAG